MQTSANTTALHVRGGSIITIQEVISTASYSRTSFVDIIIALDNKKVDTGLKKFGAILGNRAQTGCNSVTNPGSIMLPETVLLPNHTSLGVIRR